MNNKKKEENVYDVLTRYGIITDRRVAKTTKGVIVYVPAGCLGERYENMYDDIKKALNDESEVVVFHTKETLSVKEFIKNNIALQKEKDLI